ncbi:MAG TPA: cation:proton antiporter [Thermoplasmatales archaeon]|nr:cation:proton antiporter [Thermoplasmatales archaeon]
MTSTIVRTTTRVMLPFIIVFGIYVIAYGHISPGGGFQGGMILAGAAILLILSYGFDKPARFMSHLQSLESGGVLLFIFIGSITLLLWLPYLADLGIIPILNIIVAVKVFAGVTLIYVFIARWELPHD